MSEVFLYSIGHGTRPDEDFYELLRKYEIDYLIDVRSIPQSRFNPQYNQRALSTYLDGKGIRYVFMGDTLGGRPKDKNCYDQNGKINYEQLKTMNYFKEGIERLRIAVEKKIRLAIMCSERKPQDCHRSKLIGKVLHAEGIETFHIDELGNLKSQSQLATEFNL